MKNTSFIAVVSTVGGVALFLSLLWWIRHPEGVRTDTPEPPNVQTFSDPRARTRGAVRAPTQAPSSRSASAAATEPRSALPASRSIAPSNPSAVPYVEVVPEREVNPAVWTTPIDAFSASLRRTIFLPGNSAGWTRVDVDLARPFRVQAGGRLALGRDQSGPDGLIATGVPGAAGARVSPDELVLESAPFLALVGRVCSTGECSPPFQIGSRAVLCPSSIGVQGNLELWTNNRAREGRSATRNNFSNAIGGYHVYVEPVPAGACSSRVASGFSTEDAAALAAGRTVGRPEFTISSSQGSWKPFFLPLDRPLRLRASGEMKPGTTAPPTGPDGIRVADPTHWTYPGSQLVVDADHPLFDAAAPYQSLIGRVCSAAACGPVFVVGRERTVCAGPTYRDRLELWINHMIPPPSLLAQTTSLTMDTFDFQARSGAYRFTVAEASASDCADVR